MLNLLPPTRGAGYRGMDGGHNTSSWGGAVLRGPDGARPRARVLRTHRACRAERPQTAR